MLFFDGLQGADGGDDRGGPFGQQRSLPSSSKVDGHGAFARCPAPHHRRRLLEHRSPTRRRPPRHKQRDVILPTAAGADGEHERGGDRGRGPAGPMYRPWAGPAMPMPTMNWVTLRRTRRPPWRPRTAARLPRRTTCDGRPYPTATRRECCSWRCRWPGRTLRNRVGRALPPSLTTRVGSAVVSGLDALAGAGREST